jgi:predicted Zn-dependent protease
MRAAVPLALVLCGCAPFHAAPRLGPAVPFDDDERRLWQTAGEVEKELLASGRLHPDAALDAYLLEVARRILPPPAQQANPLRVRVLADVDPNAFALPNGAIFVHTGLLARMESEAELAAILGHETAHVTHRSALRTQRRAQDWTAGAVALTRLATVTGYHRDLEREADREAIGRMQAAGYDPREALTVLGRLRDWVAAEAAGKGTPREANPYASHPRLEERIESCRASLAQARAPGGERNAEAFLHETASVLLGNGRIELAAGRYRAAWEQVKRYLRLRPDDAAAHVLLGEIARRDGAAESAAASYRRAIELDRGSAGAWRGLALVMEKRGERPAALAAFARYLELAPNAPDRPHAEAAMKRLSGAPR